MEQTEKKYMEFEHSVEDIFENASRISAYATKNMTNKEGVFLLSEYAITEDDRDMFMQGLDSILIEIQDKVIKLTSGIDDAIAIRDGKVVMKIVDNGAYNGNVKAIVEQSLFECLINGALMQWFKNVSQGDLLTIYTTYFGRSLEALFHRMFQLKVKKMSTVLP